MKKILIITFLILFVSTLHSQNKVKDTNELQDSIRSISSEVNNLRYEFEVIKRDKLNYTIEKNLLKESFSSNLQVINIVIAAILLFFSIFGGIFGYVGFKNIIETKKKFESELDVLSKLRITYEKRFGALIPREKVFNDRMSEIEKINATQSKKIRILELKNSIKEAQRDKNYQHAISLINIGLEEEPNDYNLNAMKSDCYMYLENYRMAINSTLKALRIAEKSRKHMILANVYNLLEFSLLIKDIPLFEKHKQKYIEHLKYDTINVYLETMVFFIKNELEKIIKTLIEYLNTNPKMMAFPGWTFSAGRNFISKDKDNVCFEISNDFIDTIHNKMSIESFIDKYNKN